MQIHRRRNAVLDAMSCFDGIRIVHDWQNERRRMRSKWSDSFCSLSVFNERRTNPIECTSSSPVSSMSSSDSLYRIPNGMFCSLRSYLLSIWWIVCRELLLFISCLILLHLLLHNDLDRNSISCPTVHVALSTAVCLLLSCIPNSVWWPGHSCLWFLSHCCSPTCRIACWVYYLHTCCCIHLLLSVLGSILFLNSLGIECGVQQHPHGQRHHWGCEHNEWDDANPQNPSMPWGSGCCGWMRVGSEARLHGCAKAFRGCGCEAIRVIRVPLVVSQFQSDGDEM